jgi:DNA-binding response OmpR family regulator
MPNLRRARSVGSRLPRARVTLMSASGGGRSSSRILVVDDDPNIRELLVAGLTEDGFRVDTAEDAATAKAKLASAPTPELVLLDILLAGEDGLGLLGDIRRTSDIPVILLTGKGRETDRIVGLKLGADDYVVKPFSLGELSARIETVLRRSSPRQAVSTKEFDRLTIDLSTREVRVDGKVKETTAKEFDLLAFLMSSPRQVFNREQLLDHVWGSSSNWQDSATVTEHVRRIRKKIEDDPDNPRWVVTVRGVGYRFEP